MFCLHKKNCISLSALTNVDVTQRPHKKVIFTVKNKIKKNETNKQKLNNAVNDKS